MTNLEWPRADLRDPTKWDSPTEQRLAAALAQAIEHDEQNWKVLGRLRVALSVPHGKDIIAHAQEIATKARELRELMKP